MGCHGECKPKVADDGWSGVLGGSDQLETLWSPLGSLDINGADPDHQDRGDSATPLPEYPRNADLRKWLASSV